MEQVIKPVKRINQKPDSRIVVVDAFDKINWTPITFGEVCRNINVTEKDPLINGIDRYVGLEHIEPNSLHIKSWGNVADGTTFTKKFSVGHVLFGKRRAYLRKAAIADFDGLCSGDILVFEANEDLIDLNLFPFLVQSARFFDFAVQTSAGSLSPRTKFQDLAKFEFLLPPKEQQAKLAELLWANDNVIQNTAKLLDATTKTFKSYVKTFLKKPILQHDEFVEMDIPTEFHTSTIKETIPKSWKLLRLKDAIQDVQNGFAEGKRLENGLVQLRMNNVTREGTLNFDNAVKVPRRAGLERYQIQEMDVLFNNTNSEELVGKTVIFEKLPFEIVFSNHFTRLRAKNDILLQKFLYLWLKYHFEIGLFRRRCTKWVGQAAVQTENLLSLTILLPTTKEQEIIVDYTSKLESQIEQIQKQIERSKLVYKALVNQIFS